MDKKNGKETKVVGKETKVVFRKGETIELKGVRFYIQGLYADGLVLKLLRKGLFVKAPDIKKFITPL